MVVQELGWDDDVDDDLRVEIEDAIDADMVDGDYGNVVDSVLLWWRDDDGDLVDALVDSLTDLVDGGAIWLLTPKVGRPQAVDPADIAEAAPIAGLVDDHDRGGQPGLVRHPAGGARRRADGRPPDARAPSVRPCSGAERAGWTATATAAWHVAPGSLPCRSHRSCSRRSRCRTSRRALGLVGQAPTMLRVLGRPGIIRPYPPHSWPSSALTLLRVGHRSRRRLRLDGDPAARTGSASSTSSGS